MPKIKRQSIQPYIQMIVIAAMLCGLAGFVYLIINGALTLDSQAARERLRCGESCNTNRDCAAYAKRTATGDVISMHCFTGRYGRHSVGDGTGSVSYRGTCAPRGLRPASRIQVFESCRGLEPFTKSRVAPLVSPRPTSGAVNRFAQPTRARSQAMCNSTCEGNSDCRAAHFCYSFRENGAEVKRCRSRVCRTDTDCVCDLKEAPGQ
ncbi:MAG: hypothetical protein UZ21_OP11001000417 [Microgenomates bacterium OLB22]|nr:MAG: hypothetical protein UZ21_OP11001000417 [Microgenomates bacterium OLB22]